MWTTSRSPWCQSPAEAVHRSFCGRNSPNSTEPYAATVVIYAEARGRVRRRYRRTDDHGVDLLATGHGEGKGSCLSFLRGQSRLLPITSLPAMQQFFRNWRLSATTREQSQGAELRGSGIAPPRASPSFGRRHTPEIGQKLHRPAVAQRWWCRSI